MKTYLEPSIKIFEFDKEEILTASGLVDGGQGGSSEGDLEWDEVTKSIIHD